MNVSEIKPDLMIHAKGMGSMGGAAGKHVGTVDHLEGDKFIKLKKNDSEDGQHHWIPLDWVDRVDAKAVYLNKTEDEFKSDLIDENPAVAH